MRMRLLPAVTADARAVLITAPGPPALPDAGPVPAVPRSAAMVPGTGGARLSAFLALSMAPLVSAGQGGQLALGNAGQD